MTGTPSKINSFALLVADDTAAKTAYGIKGMSPEIMAHHARMAPNGSTNVASAER